MKEHLSFVKSDEIEGIEGWGSSQDWGVIISYGKI